MTFVSRLWSEGRLAGEAQNFFLTFFQFFVNPDLCIRFQARRNGGNAVQIDFYLELRNVLCAGVLRGNVIWPWPSGLIMTPTSCRKYYYYTKMLAHFMERDVFRSRAMLHGDPAKPGTVVTWDSQPDLKTPGFESGF